MVRLRKLHPAITFGLLAVCAYGSGPDVIVSRLHDQTTSYGYEDPQDDGDRISAFSIGTDSCNIGDQNLDWNANTNQHPAIHQSMYRKKNDRFEQIGMGWIKHGFFALNNPDCGLTCTAPINPPGDRLYVGCSDPYSAGLNGNRNYLGPTWEINAHTGYFPDDHTDPATLGIAGIANRLQVHNYDLQPDLNAGALYFVQGHYVHPDDAFAGNGNNNASYRRILISRSETDPNRYNAIGLSGATMKMQSAIRAWKDNDSSVVETDAQVPGEGLFILAAKVTELGNGFWHYDFALQNLNSDRSGGSFTIPLPQGVSLENIGFHDVDYHSGDGPDCPTCICSGGANHGQSCTRRADCPSGLCIGPLVSIDGTDWEVTIDVGKITWSTTPYDVDNNANALRWSTLYNFRFDANIGPDDTTVTLGLFKPGFPSQVNIQTTGPNLVLIDCNENTFADTCDVDCGSLGCTPPCGGSSDCNDNLVPDECESDCQPEGVPGHGIPDSCDIRDGTSLDCQPNTVPDECEGDCDGDTVPDTCETITDTDGDGVDDCDDLCPATTPINACVPPSEVICCFCATGGLCIYNYPRGSCLSLNGTPICSEPPTCLGTVCPDTQCRDGCLLGDFDRDGDLDLFDFGALQICYSASIGNPAYVTPSAECLLRFDFDGDGDIDPEDFSEFLGTFSGP